jgi:tryptophan synthase alpha chain
MSTLSKVCDSKKNLVAVYLTAGFPTVADTVPLCRAIQEQGVDILEIGIPFSDSVADGPTVQRASMQALHNGVTLQKVLVMVQDIRQQVSLPIVLMGSFNPIFRYGVERFCKEAEQVGVEGVIVPDLPLEEFEERYRPIFLETKVSFIFLITSETSVERIQKIDRLSTSFIYVVSSRAVTGGRFSLDSERMSYLEGLSQLKLSHPLLVGFGIQSREDREAVSKFANGVVIGSAFLRALEKENPVEGARKFLREFLL